MKLLILSGEHAHDMSTVLGNSLVIFISFVILLYILTKYAIGPVLNMIERRQQHINEQIDSSQQKVDEATQLEQEAKQTLKQAQIKANQLLIDANDNAQRVKEESLKGTQEEILTMQQVAKQTIGKERAEMMAQLQTQVGQMSVSLAQKIIQRELTQEDHQRLIEDFIEGLEK